MSESAEMKSGKSAPKAQHPELRVAAKPEPKPPAISERDLLRLHQLWQTSLDPELLLQAFASEVKQFISYDSLEYRHTEAELHLLNGSHKHHRCSYKLTLEGQALGDIELTRSHRFSEDELYALERILGTFIHNLRNAIDYRKALQSAYTDSLTGLLNRNALNNLLAKEIQRSLRANSHLSVLLIDIDNFKEINDQFGHHAGDQILTQVARTLEDNVRAADSVFRQGGEEFIVALPGTDLDGAKFAGEKIRRAIGASAFLHQSDQIQTTISIGATTLASGDDMHALIHKADLAMYQAKKAGRNCLRAG